MKNKQDDLSLENKVDYMNSQQFFNNQIVENESLLTKKEIAKFLNVSVKMIDKKVHTREIPFMHIGRLVRFSKSEVLAWAKGSNSSR